MDFRQCASCGTEFRTRPHVLNHLFCSDPRCQKERRRRWQYEKRKNDSDYRKEQSRIHGLWLENNPGYSKKYRQSNPEYVAKNRLRQRERNKKRRRKVIAKMDSSTGNSPLISGLYRLTPINTDGIAKMDTCLVEIKMISNISDTADGSTLSNGDCKRRRDRPDSK